MSKLPTIEFIESMPNTKGLIEYEEGRPLFLLESHFIVLINNKGYCIPKGFTTDYASVPRGLWNMFPPYDPKYAAAALLHDWAYAGEYFPRDKSDLLFRAAMRKMGVTNLKATTMYAAVRLFGGSTYRKHTLKSVMEVRALSGIEDKKRPFWKNY